MDESGQSPVRKLVFSSQLPLAERDRLEDMVFFNRDQEKVRAQILACVQKYGVPAIVEDGPWLRFRVPGFSAVQSLYALDVARDADTVAGVAMFVRESSETMLLLHLAVHEEYTADGAAGEQWVAPQLIAALRAICLQTRGVGELRLLYPREVVLPIRGPGRST